MPVRVMLGVGYLPVALPEVEKEMPLEVGCEEDLEELPELGAGYLPVALPEVEKEKLLEADCEEDLEEVPELGAGYLPVALPEVEKEELFEAGGRAGGGPVIAWQVQGVVWDGWDVRFAALLVGGDCEMIGCVFWDFASSFSGSPG